MIESTFSPEAFYYRLQNSRKKDFAFHEWRAYRKEVTDLLLQSCDSGSTLAVFGAGPCNDLDLARLSEHFSQITLLDFNEASMKSALRRYSLEASPRIRLEISDFAGITDEDYIDFLSQLQKEYLHNFTSSSPALESLNRMYEKARRYMPDFGQNQYDCCLALNIHSQLNDTADWLRTSMSEYMGRPLSSDRQIAERVRRENTVFIKKFNDALLSAVRHLAFIGYETGLENREGLVIQGAFQAFEDLRKRQRQGFLHSICRHHLLWPCDRAKDIVFSVLLETLQVAG